MKKLAFIIVLAIVVTALLSVAAFYSVPFVKGNNCIIAANKTVVENEGEDNWIGYNDLAKLQLLSDETILADTYISLKTKVLPKWSAWNNLTITYEISAVATDEETGEVVQEAKGTASVQFVFKDLQWIVVSVEKESQNH